MQQYANIYSLQNYSTCFGCCDTRNMQSSFAVNKYLHTSWNPLGLSRPVMGLLYLLENIKITSGICTEVHSLMLPSNFMLVTLCERMVTGFFNDDM